MKKFHIILLVVFGVFLIPNITFACEKHSCKKESSRTVKDDCCSKGTHSGKNHDGCGGKCGHSQCGCASVCPGGLTFTYPIEIKESVTIAIDRELKFYHSETAIAAGFNFLWLIPKIS